MPRKTPMPEREISICRRLREFREKKLMITRVRFALELGIDSGKVSMHEHCRVPLRYGFVEKIGARFNINAKWLATGVGEMTPWFSVPENQRQKISERMLFSEAFDSVH